MRVCVCLIIQVNKYVLYIMHILLHGHPSLMAFSIITTTTTITTIVCMYVYTYVCMYIRSIYVLYHYYYYYHYYYEQVISLICVPLLMCSLTNVFPYEYGVLTTTTTITTIITTYIQCIYSVLSYR